MSDNKAMSNYERRVQWAKDFLDELAEEVKTTGVAHMGSESSLLRAAAVKHIEWLLTISSTEANDIVKEWFKEGPEQA